MKTIKEFVKEINASEELQKALENVQDKASLEELLKKNGCGATAEEFLAFAKSQSEGEIGDDDAEGVAGGVGGGSAEIPRIIHVLAAML